MEKTIVISIGGSLIVPDKVDLVFIKNFRDLVYKYIKKGFKFIMTCGGGKIARDYRDVIKKLKEVTQDDLDWLGIYSTRINAYLLKTIFRKVAHQKIIKNPTKKIKFKEKVLITAGWKPGFSTDYDAVLLARNFKVRKIINLTNTDYVYDKDPKKFKNAKPIKRISWKEFRKIIPKRWNPGLNVPFDPVAAREAEKLKLEVVILNGKKLKNFENYLNNKPFKGTLIKDKI